MLTEVVGLDQGIRDTPSFAEVVLCSLTNQFEQIQSE